MLTWCRFTISGLVNFHKPSSQGRRSTEFWKEGLKILETCELQREIVILLILLPITWRHMSTNMPIQGTLQRPVSHTALPFP